MDLIVGKRYVVLIYIVPCFLFISNTMGERQMGMYTPFLKLDFAPIRTGLCGDELLEVADGVIRAAFDSYWTDDTSV
jgi:hypothetical protein